MLKNTGAVAYEYIMSTQTAVNFIINLIHNFKIQHSPARTSSKIIGIISSPKEKQQPMWYIDDYLGGSTAADYNLTSNNIIYYYLFLSFFIRVENSILSLPLVVVKIHHSPLSMYSPYDGQSKTKYTLERSFK